MWLVEDLRHYTREKSKIDVDSFTSLLDGDRVPEAAVGQDGGGMELEQLQVKFWEGLLKFSGNPDSS